MTSHLGQVTVEMTGPDGQSRTMRLPMALVARLMLAQQQGGGDDDDDDDDEEEEGEDGEGHGDGNAAHGGSAGGDEAG